MVVRLRSFDIGAHVLSQKDIFDLEGQMPFVQNKAAVVGMLEPVMCYFDFELSEKQFQMRYTTPQRVANVPWGYRRRVHPTKRGRRPVLTSPMGGAPLFTFVSSTLFPCHSTSILFYPSVGRAHGYSYDEPTRVGA